MAPIRTIPALAWMPGVSGGVWGQVGADAEGEFEHGIPGADEEEIVAAGVDCVDAGVVRGDQPVDIPNNPTHPAVEVE